MYRSNNNWLCKKEKILPYIRLTGIWLQKAGFEIGQEISVTVKNKQLIITLKDKK